VVAALAVDVVGGAVIGAGSELAAEGIDHQKINWSAVGISAGIGAAMSLVGFGVGRGAKLGINRFNALRRTAEVELVSMRGILRTSAEDIGISSGTQAGEVPENDSESILERHFTQSSLGKYYRSSSVLSEESSDQNISGAGPSEDVRGVRSSGNI
jgi:hypothetical protein